MRPLSAQGSYDNENQACSSRVLDVSDVTEELLRASSEKQQGPVSGNTQNFQSIAVSELYMITKHERNWIYAINGGSCPFE